MSIHIPWDNGNLRISKNGRFFKHDNQRPFFFMADTGWLTQKLSRDEIVKYMKDRSEKGFNVIMLQVLNASLDIENYYGRKPFVDNDVNFPDVGREGDYGYWKHIDFIVEEAERQGIYMGLSPSWGTIVVNELMDEDDLMLYGRWIARRYRDKPNIIWLNGGDVDGEPHMDIWNRFGETIREADPTHLMTFHPRGGGGYSSTLFHHESWLDFNMIQASGGIWRFLQVDHNKYPPKPTMNGEPDYEGMPDDLDDPNTKRHDANKVRALAYWSVFGGAAGHAYGNASVMQMLRKGDEKNAYGVQKYWYEAIHDEGSGQMQYMKNLMLSRPYLESEPDPTGNVIVGDPGGDELSDILLVIRGKDFLFTYVYTGRSFTLNMGKISGDRVKAWWYNPRNGESELIDEFQNQGEKEFNPPGKHEEGNDWVLVLDDAEKEFPEPGEILDYYEIE